MLTYELSNARLPEFVEAAQRLWLDPVVRDQAKALGLELSEIPDAFEEAITVRRAGSGLDPATTAIIVAFAPVAAGVARDLWQKVLLPRLEQQFDLKKAKDRD